MRYQPVVFGCFVFLLIASTPSSSSAEGSPKKMEARYFPGGNVHPEVVGNENSVNEQRKEVHNYQKPIGFLQKSSSEIPDAGETFSFAGIVRNCLNQRRRQIIANYVRGKAIIANCFKAAVILKLLKYLAMSSNASVKIFNGFLEFDKIPNSIECLDSQEKSDCDPRILKTIKYHQDLLFNINKKNFDERIVRMFVDDQTRNFREDQKDESSGNLDGNQVSEVAIDEFSERSREEDIGRELTDPKFLSVLNALSRLYLMKINLYPGIWVEMKRSLNGGIILDLVSEEYSRKSRKDDLESEEDENDDYNVREYSNDDVNKLESLEETEARNEKPRSNAKTLRFGEIRFGTKKRKKKFKKKKILKHLLIPFAIQMAILPFFLKNLLFLAVKALLAGKAALILIVFNMLRNSSAEDEDYNIRVEHYGYRRGEEYGAWINGRNFAPENSWFAAGRSNDDLEPYRHQIPKYPTN